MSLVALIREDNWQGFDQEWNELRMSTESIDELLNALAIVAEKRRMPRCLPILREHATSLAEAGRHAEAAQLVGAALVGGGPPGELVDLLFEHATNAWSDEPWWSSYCELSRFEPSTPDPRRAWMDLSEMMAYRQGSVVFHPAGWGVGEVVGFDPESVEVEVRFQSGRTDRFPLRTAVDIFQILAEEDLRTQALRDPDALKARLKEQPLEILRSILARYNGRATSTMLKNALAQVGVSGSSWSSFWRRARPLADSDPWFKVTGRGAKVEIQLLARAADPAQTMRHQLATAPTLADALGRVRDVVGGKEPDPRVVEAAIEGLSELATDESHPVEHRIQAWLLIGDRKGEIPEPLLDLFRQVADAPASGPMQAPPLWLRLASVPTARDQEKCLPVLKEVLGENWLDRVGQELVHAPHGLVKPLVDALLADQRLDVLAEHYVSLLARPSRSPFLLILLTKLAEDGKIEGAFPTPLQRAQALVELAVHLFVHKKGNAVLTRAHQRLVDLLTKGEPPLLRRLLGDATPHTMQVLQNMLIRGVEDVIDTLITDRILDVAPELIRGGDQQFWDAETTIWTTRNGLRKREEVLRELVEVKMPENSEAIARARGYGDLSENFEWKQAIEEQRQLSDQVATVESDLRNASLLEQMTIPEDTVAPGTAVTFRETESGRERRIVLLGPWDDDVDDAVSYRAPLAQGMLGLHTGDRARIALPQGQLDVEVVSIEPVPLD